MQPSTAKTLRLRCELFFLSSLFSLSLSFYAHTRDHINLSQPRLEEDVPTLFVDRDGLHFRDVLNWYVYVVKRKADGNGNG